MWTVCAQPDGSKSSLLQSTGSSPYVLVHIVGPSAATVQRTLRIMFNVSSFNIPAFKTNISKKGLFYQESITKALSNVMEHHISLRRASNENDVDCVSYVDTSKKLKIKVVVLWENIRLLLDRCVSRHLNRLLRIFVINFPSYFYEASERRINEASKPIYPVRSNYLSQGSQTRGPRAACGTRGPFVRPAMLLGNFQIINISLPSVLKKDATK